MLGILALNHIANTMWPFDVSRIELVRATAHQRVDASMLLAAANSEIILAFLASVVVAVTGLALPIAYFMNERFDPQYQAGEPPSMMTITRQALLAGLSPWRPPLVLPQTIPGINVMGAAMLLVEISADMPYFPQVESAI